MNSSKKQMNEFVFTTMRRVFVRFLEEIEDSKKAFRNYLTFSAFIQLHLAFHEILKTLGEITRMVNQMKFFWSKRFIRIFGRFLAEMALIG